MDSSRTSELSTASVVALLVLAETFTGDTAETEAGVGAGVADEAETDTAGSEVTLFDDWVRTGLVVVVGVDDIGGGGDTEDDWPVLLTGAGTDGVTVGRELAEGLEVVGVAVS